MRVAQEHAQHPAADTNGRLAQAAAGELGDERADQRRGELAQLPDPDPVQIRLEPPQVVAVLADRRRAKPALAAPSTRRTREAPQRTDPHDAAGRVPRNPGTTAASTPRGSPAGATPSNTSCRCSVSVRRTGPPDTPKPKARPNGSTRPCNAGSELVHRPAAPRSCSASSTSSASITTSSAHTARCTAEPQATRTAPPPKPSPRPTATPKATTACATTGSTPKAR